MKQKSYILYYLGSNFFSHQTKPELPNNKINAAKQSLFCTLPLSPSWHKLIIMSYCREENWKWAYYNFHISSMNNFDGW